MGAEAVERGLCKFVPDKELVVVATRGELAVLAVPAEAAHFLLVAGEAAAVLVGGAHVAVVDHAVAGARGEDVFVPGEGADAGGVASHGAEAAGFFSVVDLDEAFVGADGEVGASLDPGDGGDEVVVGEFAELVHAAGGGIPHVHA